ncbi:zinc metallopeptidase [Chloroflexota bacterium]
MFYNFDYMIFMIPAFIIMMITSWYVRSAYNKWSKVPARSRITGAQAAQRLISVGGLMGVRIEPVAGNMTDHYDPRKKILRLSRGVAENSSVASLAIAAHELGHAMQDSDDYLPLKFRAALVPMVNIGSYLGWIMIFAGLLLNFAGLAWAGVAAFASGAVFALATLPVELNASSRARKLLLDSGLITSQEEMRGVSKVLNAAALTYVAALLTAVLQLLYFVNLVGGRRR